MKPSQSLRSIFLTAAGLIVASVVAIYWISLVVVQASRHMAQQLAVERQLELVGSTLKDAETGQRGYLLTGQEPYLEPYHAALSQLQDQLNALRRMVAAGGLPGSEMDRLSALSQQKLDELDQTIRLRREQGLEAALVIVRSNRGKQVMDLIRSDLAHLESQARAEYDDAFRRAAADEAIRSVVFAAVGVLNLGFLAWAYRRISSEVRQREAGAREIARQRELLATALGSIGDGVIATDPQGRCTLANGEAERLTGWKESEALGRPLPEVFNIVNEQTRQAAGNPVEEVLRTGRIIGMANHTVLISRTGAELPIDDSAAPMRQADGSVSGVVLVFRDVTEQRQSQAKVLAQLNRLGLLSQTTRAIAERQDLQSIFQVVIRSVEDNLPIDFGCICLYDPEGEKLTVAAVGAKSQALSLSLALPERTQIPIDQNGLSRCVRGELVHEPDIGEVDFPFPRRLAQSGLRSLVIAPLLVESSVFGVFVAARREARSFSSTDCEFLRQLSEHVALAAHQAQLYGSLQRAYEDLRQTQQAVMQQERLRALGQMASGIAHDINNAISPVAIYTESLLEKEPSLSPRARGYLETIQRAINDVAATVARMREFYRERGPQLALAPVDLNQLARQVADLTRARWSDMPQQRGIVIELHADLDDGLPRVMGVESEIREALTNLIFNAVDAMPEGGKLTLRTRLIGEKAAGGGPALALLEVSDTGLGMDEETRRRCLEPFFTTKGERGTGLGLAMVFGMAQRHSAEIEIESAVGRGTTIRLSFGVPASVEAAPAQPAGSSAAHTRLRLLLVDDDPVLLKSLRDTLETDGHQIVAVGGGEEGIRVFRDSAGSGRKFDAVITDLGMPRVDGRQVAAAIKAASPSTPVIMLTGWGQRIVSEGDLPDHVNQVLGKPPKLRELREALTRCCQSSVS